MKHFVFLNSVTISDMTASSTPPPLIPLITTLAGGTWGLAWGALQRVWSAQC